MSLGLLCISFLGLLLKLAIYKLFIFELIREKGKKNGHIYLVVWALLVLSYWTIWCPCCQDDAE